MFSRFLHFLGLFFAAVNQISSHVVRAQRRGLRRNELTVMAWEKVVQELHNESDPLRCVFNKSTIQEIKQTETQSFVSHDFLCNKSEAFIIIAE